MPGIFYALLGVDRDSTAYTNDDLSTMDMEMMNKFWRALQHEGILAFLAGRWTMSFANTDADVDRALEVADKVIKKL